MAAEEKYKGHIRYEDLKTGQIVLVQGHPARLANIKHHPNGTKANRITFEAKFLLHPRNRLVVGTGYDGGTYSLYSLHVLTSEEQERVLAECEDTPAGGWEHL